MKTLFMVRAGTYFLVATILLISCEQESKPIQELLRFRSVNDTTIVFRDTKIDSTLIKAYKKYVVTNSYWLEMGKYSVSQIDSLFIEEVDKFISFSKLQNEVEVHIVYDNKTTSVYNNDFQISVKNLSGKYIDALELEFIFANPYKEEISNINIELTEEIFPDSIYIKKFDPKFSVLSELHKYNSLFVAIYLRRIVFSNGESLTAKIDGEIINYKEYSIPFYFGLGHIGKIQRIQHKK